METSLAMAVEVLTPSRKRETMFIVYMLRFLRWVSDRIYEFSCPSVGHDEI